MKLHKDVTHTVTSLCRNDTFHTISHMCHIHVKNDTIYDKSENYVFFLICPFNLHHELFLIKVTFGGQRFFDRFVD